MQRVLGCQQLLNPYQRPPWRIGRMGFSNSRSHMFSGFLLSACAHAQPCKRSSLPWGHIPCGHPGLCCPNIPSIPLPNGINILLQAQSGGLPSLLPLRSRGVGRKFVIPSLSAAAVKIEDSVPRQRAEDGRRLKKHLGGKILDNLSLNNFLALTLSQTKIPSDVHNKIILLSEINRF